LCLTSAHPIKRKLPIHSLSALPVGHPALTSFSAAPYTVAVATHHQESIGTPEYSYTAIFEFNSV
jgi:hypothetical protein